MDKERNKTGEGKVSGLFRFIEKGKPGEPLETAVFVKDKGMEGDRHADGGSRQLALLSAETLRWMKEQEIQGLCFRRYKANIETEGLDLAKLKPGMRLLMGTAVLEAKENSKTCFPECQLWQSGERCLLSSGCMYCTVAEGGTANTGDPITVLFE